MIRIGVLDEALAAPVEHQRDYDEDPDVMLGRKAGTAGPLPTCSL